MHVDTVISAVVGNRAAYDSVSPHVSPDDLSPQGKLVWPIIEQAYARDPKAPRLDRGIIAAQIARAIPEAHRKLITEWFAGLEDLASPVNAAHALLEAKRYQAQQAHLGAISGGDINLARDTWETYSRLLDATELGDADDDVELFDNDTAFATEDRTKGVPFAPKALQDRVGRLIPGDAVIVLGRPEMGKTAFVGNIAAYAGNKGYRVLYLGNEEPVGRTAKRIISRLTDTPTGDCEKDPAGSLKLAHERGYGNIKLKHLDGGGSPKAIEKVIRKVRPALVIVDQVRNVSAGGENLTQSMEAVAKALRVFGARYQCATIGVVQAGDSADGKDNIGMGDIDSSNTGVPGACDVLIGIGANHEMVNTPHRVISLPKNKIGHNHDSFMVTVDFERNKFT